jgi:hypothetical protein
MTINRVVGGNIQVQANTIPDNEDIRLGANLVLLNSVSFLKLKYIIVGGIFSFSYPYVTFGTGLTFEIKESSSILIC